MKKVPFIVAASLYLAVIGWLVVPGEHPLLDEVATAIALFGLVVFSVLCVCLYWMLDAAEKALRPKSGLTTEERLDRIKVAWGDTKAAWNDMSPEEQERLLRLGAGVTQAALSAFADRLRRKGKPNAADAVGEVRKFLS